MDIQPDLSVYIVDAGGDLVACVEGVLAQNDPVLLEVLLPAGCGLEGRFGHRSEVVFVDSTHAEIGPKVYDAWQQGRGRYLGVFSSTVTPGAGSFLAMLDFLDEHPDVGAAAPRLFFADNVLQANCFRKTLLPRKTPVKMARWTGRSSMEIDWMSSDVVFVNRIAFAECGAADFGGSAWSKKMCARLRAKGWHQFFVHYSKGITCVPL
jgi:hypothetical protein